MDKGEKKPMDQYQSFSQNDRGELEIGGVSVVSLAKKYGTPLYIMDEEQIRWNCRQYMEAMRRNFGEKFQVSYASKALCVKAIYPIVQQEGLCADVVSGGELYTALQAGFPPALLHFHGNNKSRQEIQYALESGVGLFIADSMEELETLEELAALCGKNPRVALRVKPGVDAHTHEFISTGNLDSKFGFCYETGEAMEAAKLASRLPHLDFCGVHCHLGSQIFLSEPYALAADVMTRFMMEIGRETGKTPEELNMGGGFGVACGPEDKPLPIGQMIDGLARAVKAGCQKYGLELPTVVVEPGRSIVGPAGVTAYTVGGIKKIPGGRIYAAVDGGMPDNPRYALYGAAYQAVKAEDPAGERTTTVAIAGKCCESGDLITKEAQVQPLKAGDILCVFATGAYTYSMASNYNRLTRPAMVMARQGQERLVVRRETYEQLIQNDL